MGRIIRSHRAPGRRVRCLGVTFAALAMAPLVFVAGTLVTSPADAAAGLDQLQVAQAIKANCQILVVRAAAGSSQLTRARQCVTDQTAIINALTATLTPSASPSSTPTATPSPSPTATATPPPTTTPPVTTPPATTSPPTPTPSPTPSPTPACSTFAACGFPTTSNTGVPAGTVLTPLVTSPTLGLVITQAGTVIDGKDIQGWLDVRAPDVIIRNSRISSAYWWGIKAVDSHAVRLQILDNDIFSAPNPVTGVHNDYAVNMTVANSGDVARRNHIHGFRNGFDAGSGLIADNLVDQPREYPGAHSQPIYGWCSPGTLVIDHNTLISDPTNDGQNITYASGTVYIADDCTTPIQNDRTANNNWFVGGSLTVYGGGSLATNIRITNNRFSTAQFPSCGFHGYGGFFNPNNVGNVWAGNIWGDGPNIGKTLGVPA